jgi:hypothetical protein
MHLVKWVQDYDKRRTVIVDVKNGLTSDSDLQDMYYMNLEKLTCLTNLLDNFNVLSHHDVYHNSMVNYHMIFYNHKTKVCVLEKIDAEWQKYIDFFN